ncbi:hypothetical protein PGT21_020616 [Puccinia graminis f. sp. tritici]|uniref:Uncharacterized protein n=1 Tax=Puccinia graminis f. sp. tritici TaxID=56615 RepID=A0A5B0M1K7_PUCGR|nr:hypothetical protein PGT21_020616 [Puccinia graminis f. sp. tritici]KAA1125799.1 hypothetical protein PGTUg99_021020 [Puccinia graminis f. sp. tritici]
MPPEPSAKLTLASRSFISSPSAAALLLDLLPGSSDLSTHKMQQEDPIDLVARMISCFQPGYVERQMEEDESLAELVISFRSINPDEKTEEAYLEIIRKTIAHLHDRVDITRCLRMIQILELKSVTLQRMEQIILPALKGKLLSLSLAFNSSSSHNDPKSWYDVILNDLIGIYNHLEQLEVSMGPIRPHEMTKRRIFPFRVRVISRQLAYLFAGGLRPLCAAFEKFVDQLNLSTSTANQARDIARLTTVSVEKIDDLIPAIQAPLLRVAKEEWKAIVEEMNYPRKRGPNSPESDDSISEARKPRRDKLMKAATPISKLFRIYFNKLSRSALNQSLIFSAPSMEMKEDRLNLFFQIAQDTDDSMHEFLDMSIHEPRDREELRDVILDLKDKLARSSRILEKYWDSLLLKEDPRVDQEAIAQARQWLESWNSLFVIGTDKFMQVAGYRGLRR